MSKIVDCTDLLGSTSTSVTSVILSVTGLESILEPINAAFACGAKYKDKMLSGFMRKKDYFLQRNTISNFTRKTSRRSSDGL